MQAPLDVDLLQLVSAIESLLLFMLYTLYALHICITAFGSWLVHPVQYEISHHNIVHKGQKLKNVPLMSADIRTKCLFCQQE